MGKKSVQLSSPFLQFSYLLIVAARLLFDDILPQEDFAAAEKKAYKIGATKFFLADLKKEFIENLIYPAVQANAIYEVRPSTAVLQSLANTLNSNHLLIDAIRESTFLEHPLPDLLSLEQ